jgi:hypothetical protein
MRIVLEISDEYANKRLLLIAGSKEAVASKNPWDDFWEVKVARCNNCGECCLGLTHKDWPFNIDDEGRCEKLKEDRDGKWKCSVGYEMPFRCLVMVPKSMVPSCCVETEHQPGERTQDPPGGLVNG